MARPCIVLFIYTMVMTATLISQIPAGNAHQGVPTGASGGDTSTVSYPYGQNTLDGKSPEKDAGADGRTPLETILNPDGTIKSIGVPNGTFDPAGYRMTTGPDGKPIFIRETEQVQSVPADSSWDDRFAPPGPNGTLFTVTLHGDTIIVGGSFSQVGNVEAHNVAMWNGSEWMPLGTGTDGVVYDVVMHGTDLYCGGEFSTAGGISARSIAKWDGVTWSALGSGMAGFYCDRVQALAMIGSDLFAGGCFDTAGGISTSGGIARWDGSAWHALGSSVGLWGQIMALAPIGTDLFAGGDFNSIQGTAANGIARWDGSAWHPLGTGVVYNYIGDVYSGTVWGLTVSGTDLYACGRFDTAGGMYVSNVAKWDGVSWNALGGGSHPIGNDIVTNGSDIYVAGVTASGFDAIPYVGKWDGFGWTNAGAGLGVNGVAYFPSVRALALDGGTLIAAGNFTSADDTVVAGIARYSSGVWSPLDGFDQYHGMLWNGGSVNGLATNGTDIYAGGSFVLAGHAVGKRLAKWTGTGWSAIGNGVTETGGDANVYAVALNGGDVFVGGDFPPITTSWYIDRWNGSAWTGFSGSPDGRVQAVGVVGTNVYVGGEFQNIGGQPIKGIARWDGSSWQALGTGLGGLYFAAVYGITVQDTDIYVVGSFSTAGGISANNIAKWNGSSWSAVGSLISTAWPEYLRDVEVVGNKVIVGGSCAALNNIGQSTGGTWTSLGTGTNGPVTSLAVTGTDVYAGGSFTTAGGGSASNIAKWNGSAWSALGSGTGSAVRTLAISGADLWVGGDFQTAGGKASSFIARWHLPFGHLAALPDSLSFGEVGVGLGKMDSIVVVNGGYSLLDISSVVSNSVEFVVSPASGTITPGGNQKFYLTFTPAAQGTRTGRVVFHHNGITVRDTIEVNGAGVGPVFSVSPAVIAFGYVPPGSGKNDSLLVFNTGLLPLVISSIASNDPDLSIDPVSATIAPSDSQWFHLTFTPSGYYLIRTDTLTFSHNGDAVPDKVVCTALGVVTLTDTSGIDWNLLSVPMHVFDYLKSVVYPSATSAAYGYSGAYHKQDTLRNGIGYWVRFDSPQPLQYSGEISMAETVEVKKGWNIIGSLSAPCAVSSIISIPGGMVTSEFFGYSGGYEAAGTIQPGRGYWVKVTGDGRLIISSTGNVPSAGRLRIVPDDAMPPAPPLEGIPNGPVTVIPTEFVLGQNYPNPFNPATTIWYQVPEAVRVTLKVYDVLGREVSAPVDRTQEPGFYSVQFDAGGLPSGMYYYKITAGRFSETRKMILLR